MHAQFTTSVHRSVHLFSLFIYTKYTTTQDHYTAGRPCTWPQPLQMGFSSPSPAVACLRMTQTLNFNAKARTIRRQVSALRILHVINRCFRVELLVNTNPVAQDLVLGAQIPPLRQCQSFTALLQSFQFLHEAFQ